MASLARTLNKTPSYLSPRLRPSMPGRTFSNSSELSLASNDSRPAPDSGDAISSAPGTPLLSPLDGPRSKLAYLFFILQHFFFLKYSVYLSFIHFPLL